MHFLGHSNESSNFPHSKSNEMLTSKKVVYQAGVDEKFLGDFVREHNGRAVTRFSVGL